MPDNADQPITRAEFKAELKAELKAALDNFAEAIIGNIGDLRAEMKDSLASLKAELDAIQRRTERLETTGNAILMQTAGMSKSLTDAERLDSHFAATQAAQQKAIDDLAQRVAAIERRQHS